MVCAEPDEQRLLGTRFVLTLLYLSVFISAVGGHEWARFADATDKPGEVAVVSERTFEGRNFTEGGDLVGNAGALDNEEPRENLPEHLELKERLNALYKYKTLGYFGPLLSQGEPSGLFPGVHTVQTLLWSDHRLFSQSQTRLVGSDKVLRAAMRRPPGPEALDAGSPGSSGAAGEEAPRDGRTLHRRPIVAPSPPFSAQRGLLPFPLGGNYEVFSIGKPSLNAESILHSRGLFAKASKGEPIRAIFRGTVIYSEWLKEYGQVMIIDHGEHYCSLIAHAEQLLKQVSDPVASGEVIATVGKSGALKVPGLYFEIRHHGSPVDPLEWLKADTTSKE